jgi:hypothetical protein
MSPGGTPRKSVGYVRWGDDVRNRAELFDDGSWRVTYRGADDPWRARDFAVLYRAWERDAGLPYGHGILPDLARLIGGTYVVHEPPPSPSPPADDDLGGGG